MKHLTTLVVLAAFLGSCVSPYTPSPNRPFEPITEFTSSGTISLVNEQESAEEVSFGGGMSANYQKWTDVAIQIADRELAKRGMTIDGAAARKVNMKITRVDYRVGWVKISTEIDLQVETSDGYSATYTGKNSSTMVAVPKRQVDGALMRVVNAMLKDPKLVAWLKG